MAEKKVKCLKIFGMKHLKEAKLKLLANKTFGSPLGHRKGVLGEGEKQTDGVGGGGGGKYFSWGDQLMEIRK